VTARQHPVLAGGNRQSREGRLEEQGQALQPASPPPARLKPPGGAPRGAGAARSAEAPSRDAKTASGDPFHHLHLSIILPLGPAVYLVYLVYLWALPLPSRRIRAPGGGFFVLFVFRGPLRYTRYTRYTRHLDKATRPHFARFLLETPERHRHRAPCRPAGAGSAGLSHELAAAKSGGGKVLPSPVCRSAPKKRPSVSVCSGGAYVVGVIGFEPTTSWSQSTRRTAVSPFRSKALRRGRRPLAVLLAVGRRRATAKPPSRRWRQRFIC
jgi:hypothetical protein